MSQAIYCRTRKCFFVEIAGHEVLLNKQDLWILDLCNWKVLESQHVGSQMFLHRLVVRAKNGREVDHCNHDRLDNRKVNLRLVNGSQNSKRRRKQRFAPGTKHACSSRFKGVCFDKIGGKFAGKWVAQIRRNGILKRIGRFKDEDEAARAYDASAIRSFGKFACTNASLGLLDSPADHQIPAPIEPTATKIQLKHGFVWLDPEDAWIGAVAAWRIRPPKNHVDSMVMMHRIIVRAGRGQVVDHINNNPLDNRRVNLRLCTKGINGKNRRLNRMWMGKPKSVMYKGVHRTQRGLPFKAAIRVDNILIHLGSFPTAEDAARAYDKAAVKHFGEFAATNERLGLLPSLTPSPS